MIPERFPNFKIAPLGSISKSFLDLGLTHFQQVAQYIGGLPYGRNADRADYTLVLNESKGTCSTKHALLSALCLEQNRDEITLFTGIYEMNEHNTLE
ncbi:hypothetical protein [Bacillus pinisoli]|uniref:hypothetical protein n=1 Tax=Bacillus pinisoli TaxID=2901866 RepID=UPI001FF50787|nr:hypothetical protein [Bacillus pinisoli]